MFRIYADGNLVYEPGDHELALLQPKLNLEFGSAGSLEFDISPLNPYYESFRQLSTVVTVEMDEEEIFRGRVLSSTRDFYNFRNTYCEGNLSYLVDSVNEGTAFLGSSKILFQNIIANHNRQVNSEKQFRIGNITVPDKEVKIVGKSTGTEEDPDLYSADYARQIYIDSVAENWNTTLDYLKTCLIDYLGGYLVTRRENGTNYIDWVQEYSGTASQEIEFGTNLLDLTEEISSDDLFTVLIPIGDDNLNISSVNGGSKELVDAAAVAKYGRIVRTEVFPSVNKASTLLENGQNYLKNELNIPITFTIKAVDLSMIDDSVKAIRIGDRVKLVSAVHGIDGYYTCTAISYDLADPGNTVFTLGNPKQDLTYRYRRDKRETAASNLSSYSGGSSYMGSSLAKSITDSQTGDTAKKLQEFYDEWIDFDKNDPDGVASLGATYKKLLNTRTVLENNVGINFNAPKGTIDIYADHTQWEADRRTLYNNLGVNLDAPKGTIDIYADHTQWEADRRTLYNNLGVNLDAPGGTIDIYSTTTNFNNRIQAEESATAQIKVWAGTDQHGNIGSNIALNADLVAVSNRLSAVEGVFQSLSSETAWFKVTAAANEFYASHFLIANGLETDLVTHVHNIVLDNSGTGLIVTGPIPTTSQRPFKIADTDVYKNAVSAVEIKSVNEIAIIQRPSYGVTVPKDHTTCISGYLYGTVQVELTNGVKRTIYVGLDASKAREGYTKGTFESTRIWLGYESGEWVAGHWSLGYEYSNVYYHEPGEGFYSYGRSLYDVGSWVYGYYPRGSDRGEATQYYIKTS